MSFSFPVTVPDLAIYSGDTFSQTYRIVTDGVPVNLVTAGWASWSAKWRPYQGATVITLMVDSSQAAAGYITIGASPAQTALMNGPGLWDIQALQGATVRTWLRGKTQFTGDITNG
jgi:hypothetical protein